MKIVSLIKTCNACPAQWEGILDDNKAIYIRYRWGNLSWYVGKDISDAINNGYQDSILVGDGLDGTMSDSEMYAHLGLLK